MNNIVIFLNFISERSKVAKRKYVHKWLTANILCFLPPLHTPPNDHINELNHSIWKKRV